MIVSIKSFAKEKCCLGFTPLIIGDCYLATSLASWISLE